MKKSLLKKLVLLSMVTGALYVPGMASAEEAAAETPKEFALDEVVVTANRMENKLVDTPANVSVVTAEEIERKNYQDVIEAVKNVPGVNVVGGARGDENYISINGDTRVLVMIDGKRINNSKGVTSGRANFDASVLPNPALIERIEIVKGGGSTVYGTDGAAGVINIITKSANSNYVKLDVNTGSWGTQNYKAVVSHKEGKTGVLATVSKEKQNYIKYKEANTKNHKKWLNTKYNKVTANIKVEQEIGEDQKLTADFNHSFKDGGRPGAVDSGSFADGSNLTNNFAVKYDWNVGKSNPGFVQIYRNFDSYRYTEKGTVTSSGIVSQSNKTDERKLGIDVQQTMKTAKNNTLVVGASYYNSHVNSKSYYESVSSWGPYISDGKYDGSMNNKALFLQDSWNFADTWTLNAGLRYDNHSTSGSKTTGSLAVNKKFDDNSHVYLSWSQIFNTPHTDDLYYNAGGMYGNPNLKAETGDIWNLGYNSKIGRKTQVGANVFYSKIKDAINWDYIDPNYETSYNYDMTAKNVDEQKRRGLELNYKYEFDDNWSFNANYTYVKVENKYGSTGYLRDSNQMPNQYQLGLSYKNEKWNIDLIGRGASGGAFVGMGKYGRTNPYVDSKYFTLDLSVNYKIKDNWKFYVKGYNLTNAAYPQTAGYSKNVYRYPAAGRSFLVGTEITF